MGEWRPLHTAPRAKFGETWSPKFLLGRAGMEESVAIGRYCACLNGDSVLEITYPGGVRRHEDIAFTHWMPLPHCPERADAKEGEE